MKSTPRWYESGLRFECQPDCHKCCLRDGIVALHPGGSGRPSETELIAAFMKLPLGEFKKRYVHHDRVNGSYFEEGGPQGGCPLWKDGCSIYPVRPTQCRTYPFWRELIVSPAAWEKEAAFCPGMNKGRVWSAEEIDAIISER